MRYVFFLLFIVLYSLNTQAQTENDLLEELKITTNPEDSINILISLSRKMKENSLIVLYSSQAVNIWRRIQGNDDLIVKAFEELSYAYNEMLELDSSKYASIQAYKIHLEDKNYLRAGKYANNVSIILNNQKQFNDSHIWANKSIEYYNLSKEIASVSSAYISKGNIYRSESKIDSAFHYYQLAIEYASKKPKYKPLRLIAKNNIAGLLIEYKENFPQAIKLLKEALVDAIEIGNKHIILTTKNILAGAYIKINEPQKDSIALELLTNALQNKSGYRKVSLALAYSNLGIIYKRKKKYQMAIDYYDKALKIIEKESERRIPLANIGTLYRYLSFPDSSLFYLHEAERITLEGKDSTGLREIYFSLAETYTDLGEIYEASEYYKKSISVSHVSRQKSNAIAFINSYSDSTFISKQRLDTLTQEISQRKRINLILWCSILLVILLSFIIIYRNRRQAKLQRIQLQQESMEVRKEKQELSQTVDLLEKKISARKPGDFAEQMFTLNNKRKDTFQLGSISYITVIDKTLTFYHIDGVKKFYMEGTLKKFYKNELSKIPIFIRIHRSYVINILDVQQRQKESVLLSNEVRIPVPPPHRQKLSDAFRWLDSFSI